MKTVTICMFNYLDVRDKRISHFNFIFNVFKLTIYNPFFSLIGQ